MSSNAVHRIGFRFYKIAGWLTISFAIVLVSLRIAIIYYPPNEPRLIQWVKDNFVYNINIKSAQLDFVGWNPIVKLHDVDVMSDDNRLALNIEEVKIVFDIYAILFKKIKLNDVVLKGMKVGVEFLPDGTIAISDLSTLKWDPKENTSKKISVNHLLIKDSDIHLTLGPGKSLPLAQVDINIHSGLGLHVNGEAIVVNEKPSTIQFSVDFPLFSMGSVELFCHWQSGELSQITSLLGEKFPLTAVKGQFDLKTWLTIDKAGRNNLISEVFFTEGILRNNRGENKKFQSLNGWLNARGSHKDWNIQSQWVQKDNPRPYEFNISTNGHMQPLCINLQTWGINLKNTKRTLDKFGFISSELSENMKALPVDAEIDYLSITFSDKETSFLPLEAEMVFSNASLKSSRNNFKIAGLYGALRYENGKTDLLVDSPTITFDHPEWFNRSFNANDLKLWLTYSNSGQGNLDCVLSNITMDETRFKGALTLGFENRAIGDLELSFEANEWPIKKALQLLPTKIMDETLVQWLEKSLQKGKIAQSTFLFRGNPKDFPFDNQEGVFEAKLALENALLDYDSGSWPLLSQLDATVLFHNRSMTVDAKSGLLKGGKLLFAKAVIPDLIAPAAWLTVDAKLQNQLDNAAQIIQDSPLKGSLGKSLAALNFSGGLTLDLGLLIPLTTKNAQPVQVKGAMSIVNGRVSVPSWELQAEELNGTVLFTENTVTADQLKGKLLNQTALFDISSREQDLETEIIIQAQGRLKYADIQQWLKLPIYEFISGETDYLARVNVFSDVEKHPIHLEVTSPLTGLEVKAPAPFGKDLSEKPSSIVLDLVPDHSTQFQVQYGANMHYAMLLNYDKDKWQFRGGHLNLGAKPKTKFRDDNILLVDGFLEELNIEDWKSLLGDAPPNTMHFEPLIGLKISKLTLYGESFSKTQLDAEWDKATSVWNFNFNGPSLKGHITLPEGQDKREIMIDLDKLSLSAVSENTTLAESNYVLQRPIEIKVKRLKINKKSLSDVQARVEPSWKGYDFPRIQAKLKGTEVNLSGQWDAFSHNKKVTAEGTVVTKNSSDTFEALGISGTIHQAKGSIDFSLGWLGSPSKIDYPTLFGKAAIQLNNGYVQGVDPGIGRILNLLSLDSVQRRLNLDFNDITKKGFAFDEFSGKFQFGKNKISSNKVILRGPSANIEGYGQADLENQDISGELVVMPNVTGSLPVAAAIAAGNPAVGAAVWVVDKMVGKKLQEIHRYRYRLVGTWDSPKLEEIPVIPIRRG